MSIGGRMRKRIQQDIVRTNFRFFVKRMYNEERKELSNTFGFYKKVRRYFYTRILKLNSRQYASKWINLMLDRADNNIDSPYCPGCKSFVREYVELAEEIYDIYYQVFTPSEFNEMVNLKVKNSSTMYFSDYIKVHLSEIGGKMLRVPMTLKKNRKSENNYWFVDGEKVFIYNEISRDLELYQERIRRFFYGNVCNHFEQSDNRTKEYRFKLNEIMSACNYHTCKFSEEVTIELVKKAAKDELILVEVVGDEVVFKRE